MARKWIAVGVTLVVLAGAGCASTHANTATGKAEHYIPKDSAEAYRDTLVARMLDRGYSILEITPYKASFDKDGGFAADLVAGSGSRKRVTFDFAPVGVQLRVIGRLEVLTGRGAIETTSSSQEILDLMESVSKSLPQKIEGKQELPEPTSP